MSRFPHSGFDSNAPRTNANDLTMPRSTMVFHNNQDFPSSEDLFGDEDPLQTSPSAVGQVLQVVGREADPLHKEDWANDFDDDDTDISTSKFAKFTNPKAAFHQERSLAIDQGKPVLGANRSAGGNFTPGTNHLRPGSATGSGPNQKSNASHSSVLTRRASSIVPAVTASPNPRTRTTSTSQQQQQSKKDLQQRTRAAAQAASARPCSPSPTARSPMLSTNATPVTKTTTGLAAQIDTEEWSYGDDDDDVVFSATNMRKQSQSIFKSPSPMQQQQQQPPPQSSNQPQPSHSSTPVPTPTQTAAASAAQTAAAQFAAAAAASKLDPSILQKLVSPESQAPGVDDDDDGSDWGSDWGSDDDNDTGATTKQSNRAAAGLHDNDDDDDDDDDVFGFDDDDNDNNMHTRRVPPHTLQDGDILDDDDDDDDDENWDFDSEKDWDEQLEQQETNQQPGNVSTRHTLSRYMENEDFGDDDLESTANTTFGGSTTNNNSSAPSGGTLGQNGNVSEVNQVHYQDRVYRYLRPEYRLLHGLELKSQQSTADILYLPSPPSLFSICTHAALRSFSDTRIVQFLTTYGRAVCPFVHPVNSLRLPSVSRDSALKTMSFRLLKSSQFQQMLHEQQPWLLPDATISSHLPLLTYLQYSYQYAFLTFHAKEYQQTWDIGSKSITYLAITLYRDPRTQQLVDNPEAFRIIHQMMYLMAKLWSNPGTDSAFRVYIAFLRLYLFPKFSSLWRLLEIQTVGHHTGAYASQVINELCSIYFDSYETIKQLPLVPQNHTEVITGTPKESYPIPHNITQFENLAEHVTAYTKQPWPIGSTPAVIVPSPPSSSLSRPNTGRSTTDHISGSGFSLPFASELPGRRRASALLTTNGAAGTSATNNTTTNTSNNTLNHAPDYSETSNAWSRLVKRYPDPLNAQPLPILPEAIALETCVHALASLELYLTGFSPLNGTALHADNLWDRSAQNLNWLSATSQMSVDEYRAAQEQILRQRFDNDLYVLQNSDAWALLGSVELRISRLYQHYLQHHEWTWAKAYAANCLVRYHLVCALDKAISNSLRQQHTLTAEQLSTESIYVINNLPHYPTHNFLAAYYYRQKERVANAALAEQQYQQQQQQQQQQLVSSASSIGGFSKRPPPVPEHLLHNSNNSTNNSAVTSNFPRPSHLATPSQSASPLLPSKFNLPFPGQRPSNSPNTPPPPPPPHLNTPSAAATTTASPVLLPPEEVDPPLSLEVLDTVFFLPIHAIPCRSHLSLTALELFSHINHSIGKLKFSVLSLEATHYLYEIKYKESMVLLRRLAELCLSQNDMQRALYYNYRILQLAMRDGNLNSYVYVSQEIARLYRFSGNYRHAEDQLRMSLSFLLTIASPASQESSRSLLRDAHMQQSDEALALLTMPDGELIMNDYANRRCVLGDNCSFHYVDADYLALSQEDVHPQPTEQPSHSSPNAISRLLGGGGDRGSDAVKNPSIAANGSVSNGSVGSPHDKTGSNLGISGGIVTPGTTSTSNAVAISAVSLSASTTSPDLHPGLIITTDGRVLSHSNLPTSQSTLSPDEQLLFFNPTSPTFVLSWQKDQEELRQKQIMATVLGNHNQHDNHTNSNNNTMVQYRPSEEGGSSLEREHSQVEGLVQDPTSLPLEAMKQSFQDIDNPAEFVESHLLTISIDERGSSSALDTNTLLTHTSSISHHSTSTHGAVTHDTTPAMTTALATPHQTDLSIVVSSSATTTTTEPFVSPHNTNESSNRPSKAGAISSTVQSVSQISRNLGQPSRIPPQIIVSHGPNTPLNHAGLLSPSLLSPQSPISSTTQPPDLLRASLFRFINVPIADIKSHIAELFLHLIRLYMQGGRFVMALSLLEPLRAGSLSVSPQVVTQSQAAAFQATFFNTANPDVFYDDDDTQQTDNDNANKDNTNTDNDRGNNERGAANNASSALAQLLFSSMQSGLHLYTSNMPNTSVYPQHQNASDRYAGLVSLTKVKELVTNVVPPWMILYQIGQEIKQKLPLMDLMLVQIYTGLGFVQKSDRTLRNLEFHLLRQIRKSVEHPTKETPFGNLDLFNGASTTNHPTSLGGLSRLRPAKRMKTSLLGNADARTRSGTDHSTTVDRSNNNQFDFSFNPNLRQTPQTMTELKPALGANTFGQGSLDSIMSTYTFAEIIATPEFVEARAAQAHLSGDYNLALTWIDFAIHICHQSYTHVLGRLYYRRGSILLDLYVEQMRRGPHYAGKMSYSSPMFLGNPVPYIEQPLAPTATLHKKSTLQRLFNSKSSNSTPTSSNNPTSLSAFRRSSIPHNQARWSASCSSMFSRGLFNSITTPRHFLPLSAEEIRNLPVTPNFCSPIHQIINHREITRAAAAAAAQTSSSPSTVPPANSGGSGIGGDVASKSINSRHLSYTSTQLSDPSAVSKDRTANQSAVPNAASKSTEQNAGWINSGYIPVQGGGFHCIGVGNEQLLLPDPRSCAQSFSRAYSCFEKLGDRVGVAKALRKLVQVYLEPVFVTLAVLKKPIINVVPWLRSSGFTSSSTDPSATSPTPPPHVCQEMMAKFLSSLEFSACSSMDLAAQYFLPLLIIHAQLNYAELRFLQHLYIQEQLALGLSSELPHLKQSNGRRKGQEENETPLTQAYFFWYEAKVSFFAAFVINNKVVLPGRRNPVDYLRQYRDILSRLVRMLFVFDRAIISNHLDVIETYLHFDIIQQAETAINKATETIDVLRSALQDGSFQTFYTMLMPGETIPGTVLNECSNNGQQTNNDDIPNRSITSKTVFGAAAHQLNCMNQYGAGNFSPFTMELLFDEVYSCHDPESDRSSAQYYRSSSHQHVSGHRLSSPTVGGGGAASGGSGGGAANPSSPNIPSYGRCGPDLLIDLDDSLFYLENEHNVLTSGSSVAAHFQRGNPADRAVQQLLKFEYINTSHTHLLFAQTLQSNLFELAQKQELPNGFLSSPSSQQLVPCLNTFIAHSNNLMSCLASSAAVLSLPHAFPPCVVPTLSHQDFFTLLSKHDRFQLYSSQQPAPVRASLGPSPSWFGQQPAALQRPSQTAARKSIPAGPTSPIAPPNSATATHTTPSFTPLRITRTASHMNLTSSMSNLSNLPNVDSSHSPGNQFVTLNLMNRKGSDSGPKPIFDTTSQLHNANTGGTNTNATNSPSGLNSNGDLVHSASSLQDWDVVPLSSSMFLRNNGGDANPAGDMSLPAVHAVHAATAVPSTMHTPPSFLPNATNPAAVSPTSLVAAYSLGFSPFTPKDIISNIFKSPNSASRMNQGTGTMKHGRSVELQNRLANSQNPPSNNVLASLVAVTNHSLSPGLRVGDAAQELPPPPTGTEHPPAAAIAAAATESAAGAATSTARAANGNNVTVRQVQSRRPTAAQTTPGPSSLMARRVEAMALKKNEVKLYNGWLPPLKRNMMGFSRRNESHEPFRACELFRDVVLASRAQRLSRKMLLFLLETDRISERLHLQRQNGTNNNQSSSENGGGLDGGAANSLNMSRARPTVALAPFKAQNRRSFAQLISAMDRLRHLATRLVVSPTTPGLGVATCSCLAQGYAYCVSDCLSSKNALLWKTLGLRSQSSVPACPLCALFFDDRLSGQARKLTTDYRKKEQISALYNAHRRTTLTSTHSLPSCLPESLLRSDVAYLRPFQELSWDALFPTHRTTTARLPHDIAAQPHRFACEVPSYFSGQNDICHEPCVCCTLQAVHARHRPDSSRRYSNTMPSYQSSVPSTTAFSPSTYSLLVASQQCMRYVNPFQSGQTIPLYYFVPNTTPSNAVSAASVHNTASTPSQQEFSSMRTISTNSVATAIATANAFTSQQQILHVTFGSLRSRQGSIPNKHDDVTADELFSAAQPSPNMSANQPHGVVSFTRPSSQTINTAQLGAAAMAAAAANGVSTDDLSLPYSHRTVPVILAEEMMAVPWQASSSTFLAQSQDCHAISTQISTAYGPLGAACTSIIFPAYFHNKPGWKDVIQATPKPSEAKIPGAVIYAPETSQTSPTQGSLVRTTVGSNPHTYVSHLYQQQQWLLQQANLKPLPPSGFETPNDKPNTLPRRPGTTPGASSTAQTHSSATAPTPNVPTAASTPLLSLSTRGHLTAFGLPIDSPLPDAEPNTNLALAMEGSFGSSSTDGTMTTPSTGSTSAFLLPCKAPLSITNMASHQSSSSIPRLYWGSVHRKVPFAQSLLYMMSIGPLYVVYHPHSGYLDISTFTGCSSFIIDTSFVPSCISPPSQFVQQSITRMYSPDRTIINIANYNNFYMSNHWLGLSPISWQMPKKNASNVSMARLLATTATNPPSSTNPAAAAAAIAAAVLAPVRPTSAGHTPQTGTTSLNTVDSSTTPGTVSNLDQLPNFPHFQPIHSSLPMSNNNNTPLPHLTPLPSSHHDALQRYQLEYYRTFGNIDIHPYYFHQLAFQQYQFTLYLHRLHQIRAHNSLVTASFHPSESMIEPKPITTNLKVASIFDQIASSLPNRQRLSYVPPDVRLVPHLTQFDDISIHAPPPAETSSSSASSSDAASEGPEIRSTKPALSPLDYGQFSAPPHTGEGSLLKAKQLFGQMLTQRGECNQKASYFTRAMGESASKQILPMEMRPDCSIDIPDSLATIEIEHSRDTTSPYLDSIQTDTGVCTSATLGLATQQTEQGPSPSLLEHGITKTPRRVPRVCQECGVHPCICSLPACGPLYIVISVAPCVTADQMTLQSNPFVIEDCDLGPDGSKSFLTAAQLEEGNKSLLYIPSQLNTSYPHPILTYQAPSTFSSPVSGGNGASNSTSSTSSPSTDASGMDLSLHVLPIGMGANGGQLSETDSISNSTFFAAIPPSSNLVISPPGTISLCPLPHTAAAARISAPKASKEHQSNGTDPNPNNNTRTKSHSGGDTCSTSGPARSTPLGKNDDHNNITPNDHHAPNNSGPIRPGTTSASGKNNPLHSPQPTTDSSSTTAPAIPPGFVEAMFQTTFDAGLPLGPDSGAKPTKIPPTPQGQISASGQHPVAAVSSANTPAQNPPLTLKEFPPCLVDQTALAYQWKVNSIRAFKRYHYWQLQRTNRMNPSLLNTINHARHPTGKQSVLAPMSFANAEIIQVNLPKLHQLAHQFYLETTEASIQLPITPANDDMSWVRHGSDNGFFPLTLPASSTAVPHSPSANPLWNNEIYRIRFPNSDNTFVTPFVSSHLFLATVNPFAPSTPITCSCQSCGCSPYGSEYHLAASSTQNPPIVSQVLRRPQRLDEHQNILATTPCAAAALPPVSRQSISLLPPAASTPDRQTQTVSSSSAIVSAPLGGAGGSSSATTVSTPQPNCSQHSVGCTCNVTPWPPARIPCLGMTYQSKLPTYKRICLYDSEALLPPTIDAAQFTFVMSVLTPQTTFLLLAALLGERRILIVSSSALSVEYTINVFLALMYPFHWQALRIMLLHRAAGAAILHQKRPFLIGCLTQTLETIVKDYVGEQSRLLFLLKYPLPPQRTYQQYKSSHFAAAMQGRSGQQPLVGPLEHGNSLFPNDTPVTAPTWGNHQLSPDYFASPGFDPTVFQHGVSMLHQSAAVAFQNYNPKANESIATTSFQKDNNSSPIHPLSQGGVTATQNAPRSYSTHSNNSGYLTPLISALQLDSDVVVVDVDHDCVHYSIGSIVPLPNFIKTELAGILRQSQAFARRVGQLADNLTTTTPPISSVLVSPTLATISAQTNNNSTSNASAAAAAAAAHGEGLTPITEEQGSPSSIEGAARLNNDFPSGSSNANLSRPASPAGGASGPDAARQKDIYGALSFSAVPSIVDPSHLDSPFLLKVRNGFLSAMVRLFHGYMLFWDHSFTTKPPEQGLYGVSSALVPYAGNRPLARSVPNASITDFAQSPFIYDPARSQNLYTMPPAPTLHTLKRYISNNGRFILETPDMTNVSSSSSGLSAGGSPNIPQGANTNAPGGHLWSNSTLKAAFPQTKQQQFATMRTSVTTGGGNTLQHSASVSIPQTQLKNDEISFMSHVSSSEFFHGEALNNDIGSDDISDSTEYATTAATADNGSNPFVCKYEHQTPCYAFNAINSTNISLTQQITQALQESLDQSLSIHRAQREQELDLIGGGKAAPSGALQLDDLYPPNDELASNTLATLPPQDDSITPALVRPVVVTSTTHMFQPLTTLPNPYSSLLPQPLVSLHSGSDWYNNLDFDLGGFLNNVDPSFRSFVYSITLTSHFRHFLAVRHRLKGIPVSSYVFDQWSAILVHNRWINNIYLYRQQLVAAFTSNVARINGNFHRRLFSFIGPRFYVYHREREFSNAKEPMPKHDRLLLQSAVRVILPTATSSQDPFNDQSHELVVYPPLQKSSAAVFASSSALASSGRSGFFGGSSSTSNSVVTSGTSDSSPTGNKYIIRIVAFLDAAPIQMLRRRHRYEQLLRAVSLRPQHFCSIRYFSANILPRIASSSGGLGPGYYSGDMLYVDTAKNNLIIGGGPSTEPSLPPPREESVTAAAAAVGFQSGPATNVNGYPTDGRFDTASLTASILPPAPSRGSHHPNPPAAQAVVSSPTNIPSAKSTYPFTLTSNLILPPPGDEVYSIETVQVGSLVISNPVQKASRESIIPAEAGMRYDIPARYLARRRQVLAEAARGKSNAGSGRAESPDVFDTLANIAPNNTVNVAAVIDADGPLFDVIGGVTPLDSLNCHPKNPPTLNNGAGMIIPAPLIGDAIVGGGVAPPAAVGSNNPASTKKAQSYLHHHSLILFDHSDLSPSSLPPPVGQLAYPSKHIHEAVLVARNVPPLQKAHVKKYFEKHDVPWASLPPSTINAIREPVRNPAAKFESTKPPVVKVFITDKDVQHAFATAAGAIAPSGRPVIGSDRVPTRNVPASGQFGGNSNSFKPSTGAPPPAGVVAGPNAQSGNVPATGPPPITSTGVAGSGTVGVSTGSTLSTNTTNGGGDSGLAAQTYPAAVNTAPNTTFVTIGAAGSTANGAPTTTITNTLTNGHSNQSFHLSQHQWTASELQKLPQIPAVPLSKKERILYQDATQVHDATHQSASPCDWKTLESVFNPENPNSWERGFELQLDSAADFIAVYNMLNSRLISPEMMSRFKEFS